jgi:hypothetical protein
MDVNLRAKAGQYYVKGDDPEKKSDTKQKAGAKKDCVTKKTRAKDPAVKSADADKRTAKIPDLLA